MKEIYFLPFNPLILSIIFLGRLQQFNIYEEGIIVSPPYHFFPF